MKKVTKHVAAPVVTVVDPGIAKGVRADLRQTAVSTGLLSRIVDLETAVSTLQRQVTEIQKRIGGY